MKTTWTTEQIADIITRYTAGESPTTIAADYNCTRTNITNFVKRRGIPARKAWCRHPKAPGLTTDEQRAAVVSSYQNGDTMEALAVEHRVAVVTIRKTLLAAGVKPRKIGPVRQFVPADGVCGCTLCKRVQPVSEFYSDKAATTGHQSICKECVADVGRKAKYGVDRAAFDALCAARGNRCEMCGCGPDAPSNQGNRSLCVDHCHISGKVCGLLCTNCNASIGLIAHRSAVALAAVAYLRRTHEA